MSETTLRIRTQAQLDALKAWVAEVRAARQAVVDFNATVYAPPPVGEVSPSMDTPLPSAVRRAKRTAEDTGGAPVGDDPTPRPAPGNRAPSPPSAPPGAPPGAPPSQWQTQAERIAAATGRSIIGNPAAATVAGVGLGAGIAGFLLSSAQEYLQLSSIVTQLGQRFRDVAADTTAWGYALGYTRREAASIVETLGRKPSQSTFNAVAGFARYTGTSPQAAGGLVDHMMRITRQPMAAWLGNVIGAASLQRMEGGRLPEFMQAITAFADMQLSAGGRADPGAALAMSMVPGQVFGVGDPRALGMAGVDFTGRLQGVMTSGGPMRSFLLRAMGYGKPGGPDYIEAMQRLERGVTDPQNLTDFFGYMQERGLGRGAQFRALQSVAGGSLKAHEIAALVDSLGTAEGLAGYRATFAAAPWEGDAVFRDSLTAQQRTAYEQGGMFGLARASGTVSLGEYAAVEIEDIRYRAGRDVATAIVDLRDVVLNLGETMVNTLEALFGADIGGSITDLTGALREVTEYMRAGSEGGAAVFAVPRVIDRGGEVYRRYGGDAELEYYRGLLPGAAADHIRASNPEWYTPLGRPMGRE